MKRNGHVNIFYVQNQTSITTSAKNVAEVVDTTKSEGFLATDT